MSDGELRRCPNCGSMRTRVDETRSSASMPTLPKLTIRRVRACLECGHKWGTIEMQEEEFRRLGTVERALATMRAALKGSNGSNGGSG